MSESEGEELDLCSICLSTIDANDYTLECNHKFHTKCIVEWFRKSKGNCPLCNHNPITANCIGNYGYDAGKSIVNQRCSLITPKICSEKRLSTRTKKSITKTEGLRKTT